MKKKKLCKRPSEEENKKPMAIDKTLIDQLLADYKKPEDIIGENGLLKQLTKAILERALQAELTDHLGFEKHDPAGHHSGNAAVVPCRIVFLKSQMVSELGLQRSLQDCFGELFQQAVLADDVFRLFVIGQQLVNQCLVDGHRFLILLFRWSFTQLLLHPPHPFFRSLL